MKLAFLALTSFALATGVESRVSMLWLYLIYLYHCHCHQRELHSLLYYLIPLLTYHCLLSLQIYLYLISLQIDYTLQQFRLFNSNLEIEKDFNLRGRRRQLPGKGKKLGLLIAKAKNPWAGEPGEGNPDGISSEDEHTMEPTTVDSLDIDTSEDERYLV